MKDEYSNWKQRKNIDIKSGEDFKERIKNVYAEWEASGFSEEWIIEFENKWYPETATFRFMELLKAKRSLDEKAYGIKEKKIIKEFERSKKISDEFMAVLEAEEAAFQAAGIEEGTVEYKCPNCGGIAVANRYMYGGRYHGLGSGCRTCGTAHS